jgi:hypothetical protein
MVFLWRQCLVWVNFGNRVLAGLPGRVAEWTNSGDKSIYRSGFVLQKKDKPMENGKFRIMEILNREINRSKGPAYLYHDWSRVMLFRKQIIHFKNKVIISRDE